MFRIKQNHGLQKLESAQSIARRRLVLFYWAAFGLFLAGCEKGGGVSLPR